MLIDGSGAKVGLAARGGELLVQSLILAPAAHGQVAAFGGEGSSLVAVARYEQLAGNALGQVTGQLCTLVERDASHGNEWQHVGGTHTGVGAVMLAHVNQLASLLHSQVGCLDNGLRRTHKGDHSAVGSLTGVYIEQFHALDLGDDASDLIDNVHVAPLAEVGHAFHELLHLVHSNENVLKGLSKIVVCV